MKNTDGILKINLTPLLTEAFLARFPEANDTNPPSLKGSIHAQYTRCGRKNCHCALGAPHGPYYYLFTWKCGRQVKRYIRPPEIEIVVPLCLAGTTIKSKLKESHAKVMADVDRVRRNRAAIKEAFKLQRNGFKPPKWMICPGEEVKERFYIGLASVLVREFGPLCLSG